MLTAPGHGAEGKGEFLNARETTDGIEANAAGRRWLTWLAWAAIASVVGLACLQVWFNYHVKAHSDPLNWLRFARNLGTEFFSSRFPVGYPLFLRVVLDLVGPYYVFLSNLPVLLVACYLAARAIGREAACREEKAMVSLASAAAFAVLVAVDPHMLVYLANPYRDPLSYVYLFGSILLLQSFLVGAGRRLGLLACSGLLFGAAYSVREPSILMAGPMGLYGLLLWWRHRDLALSKAMVVFGVCALAGAAPLIAQSIVQHGGALPPQMAPGGGVSSTGLHLGNMKLLAANANKAFAVYAGAIRWAWAPILAGLIFALVDRNRFMLSVVIPGGLLYGVLYLFYHVFVQRYYHVAVLFVAMVAGYGVARLGVGLGALLARGPARRPGWLPAVGPAAAVAVALALAAWQLWPHGKRPDGFRISRARAFAADVRAAVPADGNPVVFCRRNWCEWIEWFGGIESCQVPYFRDEPLPSRPDRLNRHVDDLLAQGRRVYLFDFPQPGSAATDAGPLREFFDLHLVGVRPFGRNLPPAWGVGDVPLFEVLPWSNRVVETLLRRPDGPGGWVEVHAGRLWGAASNRALATLSIDGVLITNRLPNGFSVFPLAASGNSSGLHVRVESDGPLPADMRFAAKGFGDELVYDFLYFAMPDPARVSGDTVVTSDPIYRWYPTIGKSGIADLVAPLAPTGMMRIIEVSMQATKYDGHPPDGIELLCGGRLLGTGVVDRLRTIHAMGAIVGDDLGERFALEIRRQPGSPGDSFAMLTWDGIPDAVYLRSIRVAYVRDDPVRTRVRVGSSGDLNYLRQGVWARESFGQGRPGRWTSARTTAVLPLRRVEGDGVLTVEVSLGARYPQAGPANLRATCNGYPVSLREASTDVASGVTTFRGNVPRGHLGPANDIEIASSPWCPRDYGVSDERQLGVVLHLIALETAAPAGQTP